MMMLRAVLVLTCVLLMLSTEVAEAKGPVWRFTLPRGGKKRLGKKKVHTSHNLRFLPDVNES